MPSSSARSRAPYSVYFGDRAYYADQASSIAALRFLLDELGDDYFAHYQALRQKREHAVRMGANWYDLSPYPNFLVIDRLGVVRPELASPKAIDRAFFSADAGPAWSAEVRPRGVPVPRTGRRSPYRYRRHPATQAERRLAFALSEEGEPTIRGGRTMRRLPTYWDDLGRNNQRSWKSHRQTQWR